MSLDNAEDPSSTLVRECIENESLARDLLARIVESKPNEIVQRCSKTASDGRPGSYLALLGCLKEGSAATKENSPTQTNANPAQKPESSASAPTAPPDAPSVAGTDAARAGAPKPGSFQFTRDLKFGMVDPDVKQLQIFLNAHGYPIATAGPGSAGFEGETFGAGTKAALEKFQEAHAKEIGIAEANGRFGPATRKYVNGM